jgi:hypothetical protein
MCPTQHNDKNKCKKKRIFHSFSPTYSFISISVTQGFLLCSIGYNRLPSPLFRCLNSPDLARRSSARQHLCPLRHHITLEDFLTLWHSKSFQLWPQNESFLQRTLILILVEWYSSVKRCTLALITTVPLFPGPLRKGEAGYV